MDDFRFPDDSEISEDFIMLNPEMTEYDEHPLAGIVDGPPLCSGGRDKQQCKRLPFHDGRCSRFPTPVEFEEWFAPWNNPMRSAESQAHAYDRERTRLLNQGWKG